MRIIKQLGVPLKCRVQALNTDLSLAINGSKSYALGHWFWGLNSNLGYQ
jgi:hypothetical protein